MPAPKVSILIPVFNGEAFLAECIESVLAQDFTDCEILLGDDGSTDGSVALIEKFAAKDPRIRWWRNPRNLGLSANFNCCLREARGEFVKFMLQDDKFLAPSAMRKMADILENNPGVSLVVSASHLIGEQSELIHVRDYFPPGVTDGKQIIKRCLEQTANPIGEPSLAMFRRAQSARGFDERYAQTVDLEMWFHLLEQGDFACLAEPLCAFRKHPRQQTEVNRLSGQCDDEWFMLLEEYFAKPWMKPLKTRQMLFSQIRTLKRLPNPRARLLVRAMKTELTPGWFAAYWVKRKVTQPFKKLKMRLAGLAARDRIRA